MSPGNAIMKMDNDRLLFSSVDLLPVEILHFRLARYRFRVKPAPDKTNGLRLTANG